MDRSSKALQELDSFAEPQSCRRGLTSWIMPIDICMEHGGLHALKRGLGVIPSTAASGSAKPSGSGQAPSALDFGVLVSLIWFRGL